jgi:hypothetical protein
VRIAAKRRDIAFHPSEGQLLIHDAIVARRRRAVCIVVVVRIGSFCTQCRMSQESQRSKPVVDGNYNHSLFDQTLGIVVIAFTNYECTSMNPEHHWQRTATAAIPIFTNILSHRSKHIKEKAIFINAGKAKW